MPRPDGTPTDVELIDAALERFARRLRVHLPGTVDAVHTDASGNVTAVDVRVDIGEYRGPEGAETARMDPLLPNVPVKWPGAGKARLTFPLGRGDQGLLLFLDRPTDEWKSNATGPVVARAKRWHDLADAVFEPGLHPLVAAWTGARPDAVTLGYEDNGGEGMRIHVTPAGIALGSEAPPDAVLKGTTYRNADAAFDNTLAASAAAFTTATVPIVTALGLITAAPGPGTVADGKAVATQVGALITALNVLTAALNSAASTKESGAATYLSTTVKVKG